ncbi:hypothetical protein BpHYR1_004638 [Brachionus plicatilis]|uniref:Uncharacterized protein n=1 Tax=Brachionus plicatilis TaxID=10195 RepID=A0A3M7S7S7_BRAPC|nr:hypothetical protein BpHYR1_004638 [Brachionus plicatilis]
MLAEDLWRRTNNIFVNKDGKKINFYKVCQKKKILLSYLAISLEKKIFVKENIFTKSIFF